MVFERVRSVSWCFLGLEHGIAGCGEAIERKIYRSCGCSYRLCRVSNIFC
jgi:hypothetical protein